MSVNFLTEESIIAYFENLAKHHHQIKHAQEKRTSFFFIADKYDLSEFDNGLRSLTSYPALLLDGIEGSMSDNSSNNYTDEVVIAFSILQKGKSKSEIREARQNAKKIGMEFITRMRIDSNADKFIIENSNSKFRIENINYEPIGKIDPDLYGYIFSLKIVCPFSFTVTNAIWSDL